jgi:hypothetical protein
VKKYVVFIGMGFELLGIVLLSVWAGLWLEKQKPMKNLWPVLLVFAGLGGWFVRVLKLLKSINNQNQQSDPTRENQVKIQNQNRSGD